MIRRKGLAAETEKKEVSVLEAKIAAGDQEVEIAAEDPEAGITAGDPEAETAAEGLEVETEATDPGAKMEETGTGETTVLRIKEAKMTEEKRNLKKIFQRTQKWEMSTQEKS